MKASTSWFCDRIAQIIIKKTVKCLLLEVGKKFRFIQIHLKFKILASAQLGKDKS